MPSIIFWALNTNKIIIPRTKKTKPGKPKKCAGLDKNLWKNIIENKSKGTLAILPNPYLLSPAILGL